MAAVPKPDFIGGEMLDFYLGRGYYRMQQDLFTCQFIPLEGRLHTVHWLRLRLAEVQSGPEQRRLLRLNAQFQLQLRPFELTEEYETLYAAYRRSTTFDGPPTVASFLLEEDSPANLFDTQVIEVREAGRLIAVGIFDQGARTLAGIMNFYDPAYRKHSLGKYLMLLKIEYARQQQMVFYYPGYLVQGMPKFDYKLFPDRAATEVFDCVRQRWLPFAWEAVQEQSAELLREYLPPEFRIE
jgi:arginyl-tRNA--protein-N-Asp/Glu arginylyltransferase